MLPLLGHRFRTVTIRSENKYMIISFSCSCSHHTLMNQQRKPFLKLISEDKRDGQYMYHSIY